MRRVGMQLAFLTVALTSGVAAQGLQKFEDPKKGFELTMPRWLAAIPTKPGDLQTLLQFKGSSEARDGDFRGEEVELTILIAKIEKVAGPTTGGGDEEEQEAEELKSITEMRRDALNSGRSLPDYLKQRGFKSDLKANSGYFKKPLSDDRGIDYTVFEYRGPVSGHGDSVTLIRAFVAEGANEIFTIIALGAGATAFERDVERLVGSLRRITPVAETEDHYAGSELRAADHRRMIRSKLVDGWRAFDTENYILVTNVTKQKVIDHMLVDLEVMRAAYVERFPPAEGADMTAVSTVRLCDGYDDYLRYAGSDKDGTGGYWSPLEEELVIFNPERKIPKARPWLKDVDPISVMYHEAMHQYFHYSNRHVAPGSWFNEGFGEVFGGAEVDRRAQEIDELKVHKFRMKMIRAERKRAGTPDLRMMAIMPQYEFYGPGVLINYANAWSFCYFLELERHKPERDRKQAWADLPRVYLENLRKVTAEYRGRFPEDAPDDWIMQFNEEIQRRAIDLTLETVDVRELEDAWQSAVMKWR